MNVQIVNKSKFELPKYATIGSSGMDLKVDLNRKIDIIGRIDYNYESKNFF